MLKRIDVLKCRHCGRLEFRDYEKTLLGFMKSCPLCGGPFEKKESIFQLENKGYKNG